MKTTAERIADIRRLSASVCALPDEACKTTARNRTVCDYLTATSAETMVEVLSDYDAIRTDLDEAVRLLIDIRSGYTTSAAQKIDAFLAKRKGES